ncbi:hypothetical protein B296_00038456 [Ensete ventricosum]|uniref:Uncharacterized protein n=1 Tax=Ensete ventricosum TaxID=4639 RepID=A0A426XPJ3_ENSVE|nr:hypothetical protein B296_00038456 [Ensete ventricosum]
MRLNHIELFYAFLLRFIAKVEEGVSHLWVGPLQGWPPTARPPVGAAYCSQCHCRGCPWKGDRPRPGPSQELLGRKGQSPTARAVACKGDHSQERLPIAASLVEVASASTVLAYRDDRPRAVAVAHGQGLPPMQDY